jgi:hypothetical protein
MIYLYCIIELLLFDTHILLLETLLHELAYIKKADIFYTVIPCDSIVHNILY